MFLDVAFTPVAALAFFSGPLIFVAFVACCIVAAKFAEKITRKKYEKDEDNDDVS